MHELPNFWADTKQPHDAACKMLDSHASFGDNPVRLVVPCTLPSTDLIAFSFCLHISSLIMINIFEQQ